MANFYVFVWIHTDVYADFSWEKKNTGCLLSCLKDGTVTKEYEIRVEGGWVKFLI